MSEKALGTKCVQGGYRPQNGEPRQIPIVQSTTFKYDTSEDMGKLFDLEASGYFYTRLQNPTNDFVAAKICELEGGSAAMLTSSGQAANFYAVFNIATNGDHVVASASSLPPSPWILTDVVILRTVSSLHLPSVLKPHLRSLASASSAHALRLGNVAMLFVL